MASPFSGKFGRTATVKIFLVWLVGVIALSVIQFTLFRQPADPDGYYHLAMGHVQISHVGQFPWLQFTTWNGGFADQHYLYHRLFAFSSSLTSLPWIVVLTFGFALLLYLAYGRAIGVRLLFLLPALLLFGSADFLYRINLVKATPVSLGLLFLALLTLHRRWYWLLGVVAALYVLTYGGFVVLPMLVALYLAVQLATEKRFDFWVLGTVTVGIIVGLLVHPDRGAFIPQLYTQIFQTGLGAKIALGVGREWYPYSFLGLIQTNALILFGWVIATLWYLYRTVRLRKVDGVIPAFLWLSSVVLFLLTLRSIRFVDYWLPFAALFAALVCDRAWYRHSTLSVKRKNIIIAVTLLVIGVGVYISVHQVALYTRQTSVPGRFKAAVRWLEQNSHTGDIVLNTQWDQFPQLFYFDKKNYYIVGLDPTFMYVYNPALYWKWRALADDRPGELGTGNGLLSTLSSAFHPRYIFVENQRNPQLLLTLEQDPASFNLVFNAQGIRIYEIKGD